MCLIDPLMHREIFIMFMLIAGRLNLNDELILILTIKLLSINWVICTRANFLVGHVTHGENNQKGAIFANLSKVLANFKLNNAYL